MSLSRNANDCIPISEVKAYCELFNIYCSETVSFLLKFIRELNIELSEYKEEVALRDKRKADLEAKSAKARAR